MENQNGPSQTSPEPTVSQPPIPLPRRSPDQIGTKAGSFLTSKLFLITVVILILFIIAYAGIYLSLNSQLNQITKSNPTPTIASQPSPTPIDETANPDLIGANWKTYTNTKHQYQIQYPREWYIETTPSDTPTRSADIIEFSKLKNKAFYEAGNIQFNINAYQNSKHIALKDYLLNEDINVLSPLIVEYLTALDEKIARQKKVEKMQKTTFKGLEALQVTRFRLFVNTGNNVFLFYFQTSEDYTLEFKQKLFDQILSTFKFTDQNDSVYTSNNVNFGTLFLGLAENGKTIRVQAGYTVILAQEITKISNPSIGTLMEEDSTFEINSPGTTTIYYDASPICEPNNCPQTITHALATIQAISCIKKPACLDATPRCLIAEPANGWCPQ